MLNKFKSKILSGALLASLFVIPTYFAKADALGDNKVLNVNPGYDQFSRTSLSATLRLVSDHAYFYVEDRYWDSFNTFGKNFITTNITTLAQEFDNNIYPRETQFWGSEANPGIDNDPRVVVLLEDLISGNGGYFSTSNVFLKTKAPNSNEREMLAINIEALGSNLAKSFLAHEFQHLISSNQKEVIRDLQEDVWLNELRSEYSISVVGYNEVFANSNLQKRIQTFLESPSDSLTEWPNINIDYAQATVFSEYLAEQYGQAILSESLRSLSTGIESISKFLQDHGYAEKFSDVFQNWTIANYLNNINTNRHYGYLRNELKNIKVAPQQYTLSYPLTYTFSYSLKPWQAAWYQFNFSSLPQDKALKINSSNNRPFKILYADNLGRVGALDSFGYITNPGGLSYIVIMPINESQTSAFTANDDPGLISISVGYIDNVSAQPLKDGDLIKRKGSEPEMYVVEGKYKRYLRPEIVKLYGHLDPSKVVEVDDKTFNSYTTANYVRYVNEKKVYAVWPDGTKHWLNMTGEYFTQSSRDWNAIFIINELELNAYKTGEDIKK